jgi:putative DNA primase/helicase
MSQIDFAAAGHLAMANIDSIIDELLPGGKRQGREYTALNPTRADAHEGSFKVNLSTGAWSDFATGDAGDLIGLYAYVCDIAPLDAAKVILKRYGGVSQAEPSATQKPKRERRTIEWTPILPVPDDAPEIPVAHRHYGLYGSHWDYRDAAGRWLGRVCRFDRTDSKGCTVKDVLPLTFCLGSNRKREWQYRSWDVPRPLFGLDALAAKPDMPVLIVEGEKCREAANAVAGLYVPVSWPGGGKAVKKADWSPLAGREVVIWPDNDEPGVKAAHDIATLLDGVAAGVRIIEAPGPALPKGWDIADAVEDGWTMAKFERFIASAKPVKRGEWTPARIAEVLKTASTALPQPTGNPVAGGVAVGAPSVPAAWTYHQTDAGAAQLFVDRYGHILRYNARPFGKWFWFDGIRWREDCSNMVFAYVDRTIRDILSEAGSAPDTEERDVVTKWAYKLESLSRQKALVNKAETLQSISIGSDELDRNGWLFNTLNCTIDLESGEPEPREHRATDYITTLSPVVYDPTAKCPKWEAVLRRYFADNEDTIGFMQRAVGYSLTADVSEQVLFFSYGIGANGKSVFFETIRTLMGEYAGKAPTEMLMQQQFAQHPTDIANLRGKRFVVASEVEDGCRWAESRLKDLTGGDVITARRMREDPFEFQQTFKLWLFGNHKPQMRGIDEGIQRRMRIIPFEVTIPPEERIPFSQLLAMLRAEMPGILNWALKGYVDWREKGLGLPQAVRDATVAYFADNDIFQQFIDECCVLDPMRSCKGVELWKRYCEWGLECGIKPLGARGMYRVLGDKGIKKRAGHANVTMVDGIDLNRMETGRVGDDF